MADLTVLSPHPLITLSYYSDQRVAAITDPSDDVSLAEEESAQEQEAEPSSDVVHESPSAQSQSQADTSLLCPPSPNVRRRQKRLRSLSPDGSEVTRQRLGDEFTGDSNEAPELVVPSYTRSFHPFNYPSSPNLALLSATSRGNLARPDPPLFRPKTFWRHTKRSAVTAPSYSPSSYLVRRSTFIAAGLSLDKPHADLSALSVELRVGTLTLVPNAGKVGAPAAGLFHRQDVGPTVPMPAGVVSTSSDYWWPYPAATATDGATSSPTTVWWTPSTSTSLPTLLIPTLSSMVISTTSTSTLADTSALPDNASISSSATDTPALSTITALPPISTPSHFPHAVNSYKTKVNPLYFTPLVVSAGLLIGLLAGWFGYSVWNTRRGQKAHAYDDNPFYEGAEEPEDATTLLYNEKPAVSASPIKETASIEDAPEMPLLPFKYPGGVTLRDDGPQSEGTWSRLSVKAIRGSPLLTDWRKIFSTKSDMAAAQENSGTPGCQPRDSYDSPSANNHQDQASPAPTTFSSVATSDDEDDKLTVAQRDVSRRNAVRQKSLRKRIADKFFGSIGRREHLASDGAPIERRRGTTPEMEEGVLNYYRGHEQDDGPSTLQRKVSRTPSTHGRALSDFTMPHDMLQTPSKALSPMSFEAESPRGSTFRQAFDYLAVPFKDMNVTETEDRYTPLPERSPRSRRKLISSRSIRKRSDNVEMKADTDTDASAQRVLSQVRDRSFLPTSPPLLSSDRLDSQLFFSPHNSENPIINPSISTSLSRPYEEMYRKASSPPLPSLPAFHDSESRSAPRGPRQSKKLLSIHSARHIEVRFPGHTQSSPSYERVLPSPPVRTSSRSHSASPTKSHYHYTSRTSNTSLVRERSQSMTSQSQPYSTPTSPKQRYEARRNALSRVDEIVSRSYSTRVEVARRNDRNGRPESPDESPRLEEDYFNYHDIREQSEPDERG